jgi:hypothetical protein
MPFHYRSDGDYVTDAPNARKIMPYIMQKKNESMVYFEQKVDTRRVFDFLHDFREKTGLHITLLHLIIWAAGQVLAARPRLNRFIADSRIFQRRGIWVSFSAKKGKTDNDPIFVVKKKIDPTMTLKDLVHYIDGDVRSGREGRPSSSDLELKLLFLLPHCLIKAVTWLVRKATEWGLMPASFINADPFFASIFVANLGSIGLDAGYHHLYEYGNIPVFLTIGQVQSEIVVTEDNRQEIRPMMSLKYTLDERVEDGLYCAQALQMVKEILEDPQGKINSGL